MRIIEAVTVPAKTANRVTKLKCDICETVSSDEEDWNITGSETDVVTIQRTHGVWYPECDTRKTVEFHLCPTCFETRLLPWLAEQGATPTEHDVDEDL